MKLTDDRISHIAHKIHDRLYLDEILDYSDEDEALQTIKGVITAYFQLEDQLEDLVRQKIKSLKKGVTEGSPEWDVLYRKYFEEELKKRGH